MSVDAILLIQCRLHCEVGVSNHLPHQFFLGEHIQHLSVWNQLLLSLPLHLHFNRI